MALKKSLKLLLFTGLIIMTCIFVTSCGETTETAQREQDPVPIMHHQKELKQDTYDFDNPPQFRKDGELTFIDGETGDPISRIDVEIASTDFQRQMGLMFRPEMEWEHGMLFLFDREVRQSFWMKNTIIPLDILYVNSNREIIDIYHSVDTMSNDSYPSSAPAIYVVEVNAGYCKEHGIVTGDKIMF